MTRIMEDQRSTGVARQLTDVNKLFDNLEEAGFEPLPYLLCGQFDESFFVPFFELYKALKRIRFTCPKEHLKALADLRVRLVTKFTDPVLRDLYYVRNQNQTAAEVRAIKDKERAAWIEAKRQRKEKEKEAERVRVLEEKEKRHAELEVKRAARAVKQEEWRLVHEEKKEIRRQQLASLGFEMKSVKHEAIIKKKRRRRRQNQEVANDDSDVGEDDVHGGDDDSDLGEDDSDVGSDMEEDQNGDSATHDHSNNTTPATGTSSPSEESVNEGSEQADDDEEGDTTTTTTTNNKTKEEQSRGVLDALELNGSNVVREGEKNDDPTTIKCGMTTPTSPTHHGKAVLTNGSRQSAKTATTTSLKTSRIVATTSSTTAVTTASSSSSS